MADLDLLRDINNTYGHLAGDAVLKGVAEVFRQQLRHYDVPARFGGEEFCILLPETTPRGGARDRRADPPRGRRAAYDVETSSEPIRRDDLDRRRGLPARRGGRERADPPGRPRGLPREAPGPQPRPRRDERAAARRSRSSARRGWCAAGRRAAGSRRRRCRPRRRGSRRERSAPAAPPAIARAALLLARRRRLGVLVGLVCFVGIAAGVLGLWFGTVDDVVGLVALVASSASARRSRSRSDDGGRSPSAPSARSPAPRSSARGPRCARRHDRRRGVERTSLSGCTSPLQRRRCHARLARRRRRSSCAGFEANHGPYFAARGPRRGARLLRRQHRPPRARHRDRGPRARGGRVWQERFAWLAPH